MAIKTALNRIEREIGIKRCLVLDGNVKDLFMNEHKEMKNLQDLLIGMLEKSGYSTVVWNQVDGIRGDTSHLIFVESQDSSDTSNAGDTEEYDTGDDTIIASDNNVPESTWTGVTDLLAFMNILQRNMGSNRRMAFIVDWADYVFSTDEQADGNDKKCMALLGKAIADKPMLPTTDPSENIVIIIANQLKSIPISFYSKNSDVSCINISRPDRQERKELFERYRNYFNHSGSNDNEEKFIDMMDDFSNRDMVQMAMMSQKFHNDKNLTFEKLYLLFKYGEKENPWENLNMNEVRNITETLSKRVIGQEQAIEKVRNLVVKAYMGISGIHKKSSSSAPKGILFFVGPTGVGKTELSKALADFLFGDENACIRFDMSEYSGENSDQKLIGAPPGYVGYEAGGALTNAVREKPFSVILFDEIEKAAEKNSRILDIFLQILEDGRLTDGKGQTVYFSESVIIFTSNLGASVVKPNDEHGNPKSNESVAADFFKEVKNFFDNKIGRPEILGRIGYSNIVPFNFIRSTEFQGKIAKSKLSGIKERIKEKFNLDLQFEDEAKFISYLNKGADVAKGGRDVLNAINDRLLNDLADYMFDKKELNQLQFAEGIVVSLTEHDKLHFEMI